MEKEMAENMVKMGKELMAEMTFYDPKIIQHYTAKLVKLSCQATILGSYAKAARKYYWTGAVPGFVLSWLGAAQLGGTVTEKWLLEPYVSRLSSIMKLDEAQDNVLSDVVIKEYYDDPRTRPIISKYLYAEKLLDDSSTDQPEVRWRCRYFSGDDSVYSVNFLGAGEQESNETEEIHGITYLDEVAAPFDHVFGISKSCKPAILK